MKGKYKSNKMDNKVELELEVTTGIGKGYVVRLIFITGTPMPVKVNQLPRLVLFSLIVSQFMLKFDSSVPDI